MKFHTKGSFQLIELLSHQNYQMSIKFSLVKFSFSLQKHRKPIWHILKSVVSLNIDLMLSHFPFLRFSAANLSFPLTLGFLLSTQPKLPSEEWRTEILRKWEKSRRKFVCRLFLFLYSRFPCRVEKIYAKTQAKLRRKIDKLSIALFMDPENLHFRFATLLSSPNRTKYSYKA